VTLDGAGARDLSHTAIADLVHGRFGVQQKGLPPGVVVHKATRPKSMRATAKDGSRSISFYFYAKGRGKAQITVQQEKLASQDAALKQKKVWTKSLRDLAELAAAD